jgi:hypothetical protein
MENRTSLKNEYKQRKIAGGIFRLNNTKNGRYLLEHTPNLQAKENSFNFMVSTDTCFHYKLKEDWDIFGGSVFIFEVLEEIDKKKEQSQQEFISDLEMLEKLWSEKLDASKRY